MDAQRQSDIDPDRIIVASSTAYAARYPVNALSSLALPPLATGRAWARWISGPEFRTTLRSLANLPPTGPQSDLLLLTDGPEYLALSELSPFLQSIATSGVEHLVFFHRPYDTFPSDDASDPPGAASHLPRETWISLFAAVGFRPFADDSRHTPEEIRQGAMARLFKPAPSTALSDEMSDGLILFRRDPAHDRSTAPRIDDILDIGYRETKSATLRTIAHRTGFNIQLYQDFLNLKPILESANPETSIVLLRAGVMDPDAYKTVLLGLQRLSLPVVQYHVVAQLDWQKLDIRFLISVTEGSLSVTHLLGRQTVEAANLNGITTLLLQHGLRVQGFGDRTLEFASDFHLTWANNAHGLPQHTQRVAGIVAPAVISDPQFDLPIGSPKFSDSLIDGGEDVVLNRLGSDTSGFRKRVLLGTNLHWGAHTAGRPDVMKRLSAFIGTHPDLFFIVKTHPIETREQYSDLLRPNTLIVDDRMLLAIDLSISRLIRWVDAVVSSLSTLLLDGAVAGKPIFQYDTGNLYSYRFVPTLGLADISTALSADDWPVAPANTDFCDWYADAAEGDFYERFSAVLDAAWPKKTSRDRSLVNYAMCAVVEEQWFTQLQKQSK